LWIKYREEAFGEELARNDMPVMRVLPVSKSLRESSEVLPYNALKPMVEAQSFRAVAHCPCRQMKSHVGEGCDHSLENCLHFGSMGRYMVEHGLAREISAEETLKTLKEANEEGLVHAAENIDGHLGIICNCCGCCCIFLDTKKKLGLHTISASSYVAHVDAELCAACGTCEERCPMQAIAIGDDGVAEVAEEVCIGCGVCTPTCETEAMNLVQRGEINPPPDLEKFFTVRYKAEESI
jgi:ferredoxin